MTLSYGPYSSGGGSSLTDAEWGEFAKALLGTGVIKGALIAGSAGNDFAVTAPGTGMTCDVGTGQAMVYGHWCENDASSSQTITAADPTNARIDRVVLQHDVTAKTVSIVVLTGTPAASPTAPTLTQTPSTWQLSLCQVAVGAGVTSISTGNITDERTYATPSNAAALTGATFTGTVAVPGVQLSGGAIDPASTTAGGISNFTSSNAVVYKTQQAGAAQGHAFGAWNGSTNVVPFSVGGQFASALSYVDTSGRVHDSAGLAAVEGTHNSVTPLKLSAGTTLPGTLDANEIFFLLA